MDNTKRSPTESPEQPRKLFKKTERSDSETDIGEESAEQPRQSITGRLPIGYAKIPGLKTSNESNTSKRSDQQQSIEVTTYQNSYVTESILGSGSYGTVYKARRMSDNKFVVAIKYLIKRLWNEANIAHEESIVKRLMESPHKNILVYYETYFTNSGTYLISEMSETGDIYKVMQIDNNNGNKIWVQFDENLTRHLITGIAKGLQHLHGLCIAHGDLKLNNVLLFDNRVVVHKTQHHPSIIRFDRWTAKLCDCSNAQIGETDDPNEPIMRDKVYCTLSFAAPESYEILPYDCIIADIFSLGCCLLSMLLGAVPFDPTIPFLTSVVPKTPSFSNPVSGSVTKKEIPNIDYDKLAHKLKYNTAYKSSLYKVCSYPLRSLLDGLLEAYPENRINLDQFFEHQWISRPKSREFEDISSKLSSHPRIDGIQYLTYYT